MKGLKDRAVKQLENVVALDPGFIDQLLKQAVKDKLLKRTEIFSVEDTLDNSRRELHLVINRENAARRRSCVRTKT